MARPRNAVVAWTQYLAARLAAMGLTMFDVEANLRTATVLGRLMFHFDQRHRERGRRHLHLAFPEKSPAQIDQLLQHTCEHFVQLIVEVMHSPRLIQLDSWARYIDLGNIGPALKLLNTGQPAITVTGHLGNWEVLGYFMAMMGYPMHAIARPLDNPLINDWLLGIRESRGLKIITKWQASDLMLEVLAQGGTLGFIADQNAGDKGLFVPFFGKLASTYKSIALLAIDQNVPVMCGYVHRLGPGLRYQIGCSDVIMPADWAAQRDPVFYVTARYMRAIELMIRQQPEQYLWMHRRWKSRPRFEREHKPMPSGVRRNLEELPWMTEDLMRSLMQPLPEGFNKR